MVLASGGLFLLFKPQFLLMLVPVYLQKMFHNECDVWGIGSHYSIEFVPIVSLCAFSFVSNIGSQWKQVLLSCIVLLFTFAATSRLFAHTRQTRVYIKESMMCFYCPEHYEQEFTNSQATDAFKVIPDDAPLSAQTMLSPHLALRSKIYEYPDIKKAEYIILYKPTRDGFNIYPLNGESFPKQLEELHASAEWKTIYDKNGFEVWKRLH